MKLVCTLLILATLIAVNPAHARTFKIATLAPDGTSWMKQIRQGGERIAERTQGRVKFKFYTGGIMGNAQSVLKKIRIGQLQGGAFTSGGLAGIYPDIQIYSLPFLFRSYAEVDYVRGKLDAALQKGMQKKGMIVLGMTDGGFAKLMSDTPVRSEEQLNTKKIWLPEGDVIARTVYAAADVTSVPLPMSDVYTGLQTGMIDTIGSSPMAAIALQWHTRIRYVTDIPLIYLMGVVVLDKKAFDKLSPEDQATVREIMGGVLKNLGKLNREHDRQARLALQNQGVEFIHLNQEEQQRWTRVAEKSVEALSRQGAFSEDMYQQLMRHLQKFRHMKPAVSDVR